jgi:hypothetical protein
MKNRSVFPDLFLVKNDGSNEFKELYMPWINENHSVPLPLRGDAVGHYYGLLYELPMVLNYHPEEYTLMTLDEWQAIALSDTDIETVTLYDGTECLSINVVTLADDSAHAGKLARKSSCQVIGESFFLKTEVSLVYGDVDYYVVTANVGDIDEVQLGFNGQLFNINSESVYFGFVDSSSCKHWFKMVGDVILYGDKYYRNSDVAEAHDLKQTRNGDWVHIDDWDEWDSDRLQGQNAGYHNLSRQTKFGADQSFTVGFEIEKEDEYACRIHFKSLYDETGWCKERDGSLDEEGGYELVSPAFSLYGDNTMMNQIKGNKKLQELINGDFSDNCGGHINIGSNKYSVRELFEGLSCFYPLLYAMYENRMSKTYSKAKAKHRYHEGDKYSAVLMKDNVLELRLPSAVRSVKNLEWRFKLVQIMCENINKSEQDILRMMLTPSSKLFKHLRKIYTVEDIIKKANKFVEFSASYNDKKINKADNASIERVKKSKVVQSVDGLGA